MKFMKAVDTCLLQKYFDFRGRASRSEFWWFMLFQAMLQMCVGIFFRNTSMQSTLVWVLLLAPSVCVSIRRLHDIDRSGWWLLALQTVPFGFGLAGIAVGMFIYGTKDACVIDAGLGFVCGYIIILVRFFCRIGLPGENRYGPAPDEDNQYMN